MSQDGICEQKERIGGLSQCGPDALGGDRLGGWKEPLWARGAGGSLGPLLASRPSEAGQEEPLGLCVCSELPSSSKHPTQASVRCPSPPAVYLGLEHLNLNAGDLT